MRYRSKPRKDQICECSITKSWKLIDHTAVRTWRCLLLSTLGHLKPGTREQLNVTKRNDTYLSGVGVGYPLLHLSQPTMSGQCQLKPSLSLPFSCLNDKLLTVFKNVKFSIWSDPNLLQCFVGQAICERAPRAAEFFVFCRGPVDVGI